IKGDIGDGSGGTAFLRNGYQSWTYSGAFGPDEKLSRPRASFVHANQENILNIPAGKKGVHTSEMFFFYGSRESGDGLFVGQYPPFNQYVSYLFEFGKKTHTVRILWDLHRKFKKRDTYQLDPVVLKEGKCNDLLDKYGDEIKSRVRTKINDSMRVGWCSWYYYFTKITPDIILSNLSYAKKNKIPYDFFQIDDGYQTTIGDWLILKPAFNGRMKEIAAAIKKAGYVPGLWLAPFIISRNSVHFNKPGWVLRDKKGKPVVAGWNPAWGAGLDYAYFALDITHPEVQDYLKEVFSTVKKEWGYDYIKLDFMYAASLPGERYDKTLTRAEVLKLGNKLIRDQVGKSQVIL
ncbi:MAG: glycoside hydrolase family 36 protein, partial [Spirochaetota bacterium]